MTTNELHELTNAIKTIKSFRDLKQNWNGYGAEPISEEVINKALKLVKELKPIPEIFPVANNSIQFEWETDDQVLYLEMEIFKDKIKVFNMSQYRGETTTIGDE
jgi:hypothetical protein